MSEIYNLLVQIEANTAKAVKNITTLESQVEKTSGRFDGLKTAVSQAAGMIMRDLVMSTTRAVGEVFELGGRIVTLRNSFEAMLESIGTTGIGLEDLRVATQGMVSDVDLLTSANKFLALHLPVTGDQIGELMAASILLGRSLGQDAAKSIDDVAIALGRATPRILDNLGVILGLEEAAQIYADRLGIQVSTMTEAERKYAFQVIAIERIIEAAAILEGTTSSAQLAQDRFAASLENAKTRLGEFLSPLAGFAPIIEGMLPVIGIMTAQALPGFITKIGGLSGAMSLLTGPVGIAIAAVAALSVAWSSNFMGIRDITYHVVDDITGLLAGIGKTIANVIEWFDNLFKSSKEKMEKTAAYTKHFKDDFTDSMKIIEYGESPGGIRDVIAAANDMEKTWNRISRKMRPMEAGGLGLGAPGVQNIGGSSSRSVVIQRGAIQINGGGLDTRSSRFRMTDDVAERLGKQLIMKS